MLNDSISLNREQIMPNGILIPCFYLSFSIIQVRTTIMFHAANLDKLLRNTFTVRHMSNDVYVHCGTFSISAAFVRSKATSKMEPVVVFRYRKTISRPQNK